MIYPRCHFYSFYTKIDLSENFATEPPGQIELPISEKKLHGENYKNVESKFEDMGFENIKYEKVRDLKFGLFAHSGDVSEVTINGDNDFKKGDNYNKKSKIKIYYHVFPK
ncbi:hypothetical protein [Lactococcus cremoris]|uniref:hypothetical protein n=1 Tax=Lactococcus lactis subsp. cremoris TaxID=1359 RepID=UPI002182228F|nr:hypothetical protein [Lactococcus cremoris]